MKLTRKQAAAAYVRIIDPSNRTIGAISQDIADVAPFSQYRADSLAYVKGTRLADRKIRALRWPAQVEPYITAMLLTYDPASIRCAQAEAAAGSYAAATAVAGTREDCIAAADSTIAGTIRSMLGLPARASS